MTGNSAASSLSPLATVCAPYLTDDLFSTPFMHWSLLLPPYWLIVVSTLSFFLLSYAWNVFFSLLLSHWIGQVRERRRVVAVGSGGIPPPWVWLPTLSSKRPFLQRFEPSGGYLLVQFLLQIAHLIYIACTLSAGSPWDRYSELYARWLNSGYLVLPLTLIRDLGQFLLADPTDQLHDSEFGLSFRGERIEFGSQAHSNLYSALLLPIAPVLMSHIVPALVLFAWAPLLTVGILFLCLRMCVSLAPETVGERVPHSWRERLGRLLCIVVATLLTHLLLQACLNYSILFYAGSSYDGSIVREFKLRSSTCWAAAQKATLTKAIVSVLSILL